VDLTLSVQRWIASEPKQRNALRRATATSFWPKDRSSGYWAIPPWVRSRTLEGFIRRISPPSPAPRPAAH